VERDGYRETLEQLCKVFPSTKWLKISEISRALGVSRYLVANKFGVTADGVSVPELARRINDVSAKNRMKRRIG
jgi:hypothetical protein